MSVWITQCLCPRRHCIMAAVFDENDRAPKDGNTALKEEIEKLIGEGSINPWCGICYSRVFTYETRRTRFASMEEAVPEVLATQMENIKAGELLGELNGPSPHKGNA